MKNKKTIIGLVGLGVVFLLLLLWPNKKKKTEDNKRSFEMVKIDEYLNREVKMPDYLSKPEELNWAVGEIEIPERMVVYKGEETATEEEEVKRFVEAVGLDYESKRVEEGGTLWLFGSKDGKYEANVDLKTGKFRYSENIYSKSAIKSNKTINLEEMRVKLTKLVGELTEREIKISNISYQEIVSPRWVSTTAGRAQAVEITADYLVNDYLIKSYQGSPIKSLYARDGRLIKFELEKMPEKWEVAGEEETIDLQTLKKVGARLFKVWKIEGNKDYQLKVEEETIKKANLTRVELQYIYDSGQMKLRPFYFIEGNSLTENGLVKLTLIFPATKSD